MSKKRLRCEWATDPLLASYHDQEWGVAVHSDRKLFELLTLEGAQAGLSWLTVLKKRAAYQEVFYGFDIKRVSRMTPKELSQILKHSGVIRHQGKIASVVSNAKCILEIQAEFGTLDRFLWQFVDGKPIRKRRRKLRNIPSSTQESDQMSKALKKRGFKFVGSTICYAFMQATGMAVDHTDRCYRTR